MCFLRGIALVVDDVHKGSKLAFRYPAPTCSSDATDFQKILPSLFAKLFRPKSALCNQSFELIIDDSRFISYPMTIHNQDQETGGEMTMFNVVFVLDTAIGKLHRSLMNRSGCNHPKSSVTMFTAVASNLAHSLVHEEKRCGYVSKEVRIMLHIRDELAQNETSSSLEKSNNVVTNNNGDSNSDEVSLDPQTLVDVLLERSTLANELKDVYHGLNENGTVHIVINKWVKLSLTLQDSKSFPKLPIRPYHTLLLLGDEEKILESLSKDCSPQIVRLIRAANPLWSFQELQLETGIPMNQVFRLASHLVYWGVARIIDTVTKHNIYQVYPGANLDIQSPLAMEFKRKFSPNELPGVLSSFCGPRRLGEYMKNLTPHKQLEFVHILVWLLQHDFIFQLHRYVHLMIPALQNTNNDHEHTTTNNATSTNPSPSSDQHQHQQQQQQQHQHHNNKFSTTTDPTTTKNEETDGLKYHERMYLDCIATNNPVFHLFKRLCVYFHGKHHLEEIMWRENVTRSEIRAVLSTYNDIAVCCLHE